MAEVMEKSTCYLTVEPIDKDGAGAAPSSGTYEVHDVDSGKEIVSATGLTPGTSMEITLKGDTVNVLQDSSKEEEQRRVTVKLDYGSSDTLNDEYIYRVKALEQVS